jgi:hypothetical protein
LRLPSLLFYKKRRLKATFDDDTHQEEIDLLAGYKQNIQ